MRSRFNTTENTWRGQDWERGAGPLHLGQSCPGMFVQRARECLCRIPMRGTRASDVWLTARDADWLLKETSSMRDVPEKAGAMSDQGAPREPAGWFSKGSKPPHPGLAAALWPRAAGPQPGAPRGRAFPTGRAFPRGWAGPRWAGPAALGAAGWCWLLWAQSQAGAFSRLPPPAQPLRPSRGWVPAQELRAGQRQLPPPIVPVPPTLPQPCAASTSAVWQVPPKAGDS